MKNSKVTVFSYQTPIDYSKAYDVSNYNLEWTEHAEDSWDSMLAGNGDIGVNVWTLEDDNLLFYISKVDALDGEVMNDNTSGANAFRGNANTLKLGRIRVHFEDNPFSGDNSFSQKLEMQNGRILIKARDNGSLVNLKLWVGANRPVIHVRGTGATKTTISLETWRDEKVLDSLAGNDREVEVIFNDGANQLVWYHRNASSTWKDSVKNQGTALTDAEIDDLDLSKNLTFGCVMTGDGMIKQDARTLVSAELTDQGVNLDTSIVVLNEQTATAEAWYNKLMTEKSEIEATSVEDSYSAHQAWWKDYWDRSYIEVTGGTEEAYTLTQNYILQCFVSGCSTRGNTLSNFNGSIFTVDVKGNTGKSNFFGEITQDLAPDFRAWANTMYMIQNTRHIYEPLPASGDFDGMETIINYFYDSKDLMIAQNKARFGNGTEYKGMMIFENSTVGGIGGAAAFASHLVNNHTLTIAVPYLMLQYYKFTEDDELLEEKILPVADACVDFFDLAFPKKDGKIVLNPNGGAETVVDALNPTTTVEGLRTVLQELLALDKSLTTETQKEKWKRMLDEVPDTPLIEFKGNEIIDVAEGYRYAQDSYRDRCETVNLYAIYPFRQYMLGSDTEDLAMARHTYQGRWDLHADGQPQVTMVGTYGGWGHLG